MKGLYDKWAVRRPHEDCTALGRDVFKVEYARDHEGRLWRRIFREKTLGYAKLVSDVTRWHVADPWSWFPGADPAAIAGARKQNTRARPPAKLDVYLIDGRIEIVVRPPSPDTKPLT